MPINKTKWQPLKNEAVHTQRSQISLKISISLLFLAFLFTDSTQAAPMPTQIIVNKDLLKEAVMMAVISNHQNVSLKNDKQLKIEASLAVNQT